MSIADTLTAIADNMQRVYDAGSDDAYDRFWDVYQKNGTRTQYAFAFAGEAWADAAPQPKYPLVFKDVDENTRASYYTFAWYGRLSRLNDPVDMTELCVRMDFSRCLSMNGTFLCASLKNVTVDCSAAISLNNTFNCSDSGKLQNIRLKITENCVRMINAFYYCRSNVILFTEGSVIACNGLNVQWADLTHESLMSILNALQDKSEDTSGTVWTITIGSTNYAKLSTEEIEIAEKKGWVVV